MAADTYYTHQYVKDLLGETGDTNNNKIKRYGEEADNKINIALTKLEPSLPVTIISDPDNGAEKLLILKPLADKLTTGLFYKYESGSEDLLTEAEAELLTFVDNTYRRPNFITKGTP